MNTRADCSPRYIKRINATEKIDDASKYAFYRQINHVSIMKLDNETDKMNYSSWLTRLDTDTSDLRMHLIKILFVSLRSDKTFQMFLKPPPDDLKDLELKSDNTMEMVKWLQDNNLADETLTNEQTKEQIKNKRSAAVDTNMRAYTTLKSSPYFVQSFYVRSDWPIYTWYNPTNIQLPTNFDHNLWELFLNRFQIVTGDKSSKSNHRNECDDIIPIDQISKEVTTSFSWHPYSILGSEENRPKRTPGSITIDVDVANQQCNQQLIDDAAFSIVFCKHFPGNKTLSQKYYDALIPDAKFIFKMTGVRLVDYSNIKLKEEETLPFVCCLKPIKKAVKNPCEVKVDKTPCPCEKPMMTIDCGKPPSRCPKKVPSVNTESDCKPSKPKTTQQECTYKSTSKCQKKADKKLKTVECCKFPKEEDDCDVVDDCNESKERKIRAGGSSFNGSSNCDWTVSSIDTIISTREPDRARSNANCTSISSGQLARVEPEDQSAKRQCSCSSSSSVHQTAAAPPRRRNTKAAVESVREPPREQHRSRRSRGNRTRSTNSEQMVENGGRAEAEVLGGGRRRTSPAGQRTSARRPRDRGSASARRGSTSDDGRRVEQPQSSPAKDLQNRSCPAPFAQSCRAVVSCSDRSRSSLQQQQQLQLQQQREPAGPSGDNRSDAARDPEVVGYSAFVAEMRSRPSSPPPQLLLGPVNDILGDDGGDKDDGLSDDACSMGAMSWSPEMPGIDGGQPWNRFMFSDGFRDVGDDNENDNDNDNDDNNYGDTAGSLRSSSTLSSSSSVELRRTDDLQQQQQQQQQQLTTSDDDRYSSDGNMTPNHCTDAASTPGSSATWPWSSSSNDSRSGPRVREFGDVRASDRYDDTSCSSEGGDESVGRDDYRRGGSETDDDGAAAAPVQRRRNY